jgi:tRNA threonylcarbamoyladenosine biosynthesis protein TsaB
MLDAGRGEFYYGDYLDGLCLLEALLTRDELVTAVNRAAATTSRDAAIESTDQAQVVVACEPAVAQSVAMLTPQLVAEPTAEMALRLALHRIHQGSFDDAALLDANYLRRIDAEIFSKPKPAAAVPQASGKRPGTRVR